MVRAVRNVRTVPILPAAIRFAIQIRSVAGRNLLSCPLLYALSGCIGCRDRLACLPSHSAIEESKDLLPEWVTNGLLKGLLIRLQPAIAPGAWRFAKVTGIVRFMEGNEDEQKRMKNQMEFIVEQQARIDANLERLTESVNLFVGETRGAINNLILANEVTRDLAQQTARLAIATSRRVSDLEQGK
jgi:hypothetical protein